MDYGALAIEIIPVYVNNVAAKTNTPKTVASVPNTFFDLSNRITPPMTELTPISAATMSNKDNILAFDSTTE
jgi:hypothetical protein